MSEAELCATFRTWAEGKGLIVYPEVSDWDMVISPAVQPWILDSPERKPDDQLGVQAKLLGNVDVLYQAAIKGTHWGPAYRMVLVPRASDEFIDLANHLGLAVAVQEVKSRRHVRAHWDAVPEGFKLFGSCKRFMVVKQLYLPPIVTDLVAGGAAPRQLTKWRVKALKLCRVLRARGWLTRVDFRDAGIDPRRWIDGKWLTVSPECVKVEGSNRPVAKMVAGPCDLPDFGWEDISAELAKKDPP